MGQGVPDSRRRRDGRSRGRRIVARDHHGRHRRGSIDFGCGPLASAGESDVLVAALAQ
jgi:hypothetical protein